MSTGGQGNGAALPLRERKREYTRAALIDAAFQLFANKGYTATTVDEIVAAAMVSRGTFFNYFEHKEGIVLAWAREVSESVTAAIDAARDAHDPPEALLRAVARELLVAAAYRPVALRLLIGELYASDRQREARARGAFDPGGIVAPIVAAGQESGLFRTDRSAADLGAFIGEVLLMQLARMADADDPASLADGAVALLLDTLARRDP